jgi:hypothetical protein
VFRQCSAVMNLTITGQHFRHQMKRTRAIHAFACIALHHLACRAANGTASVREHEKLCGRPQPPSGVRVAMDARVARPNSERVLHLNRACHCLTQLRFRAANPYLTFVRVSSIFWCVTT